VKHYIFNLETTKIKLYFEKAEYDALTDQQKRDLKSAFLWSRFGKCWVSRAKEPHLSSAKQAAQKLGFTEEQREGKRISYAEQIERRSERAEARADRYDGYADNAAGRAAQLQKPLEGYHGDIAFFTQPNINSSAGRAFTNYRERLYNRYRQGFEEYRKSDYFKGRAQTARETASNAQFDDPRYLDRRIKECKNEIRGREKNIVHYEEILYAVENGAEKKWSGGEIVTVEKVKSLIEGQLELVEKAMDKQGYLENCLEALGGMRFSKENIKPGYIVGIDFRGNREQVEIVSTGSQNVIYTILTGGAAGMTLQAVYAEISEVVKAAEKHRASHPFEAGEQFKTIRREYPDPNSFKSVSTEVIYEIIKASDTTIRLQAVGMGEKPITRKPCEVYGGKWRFSIDDSMGNTFYKEGRKDAAAELAAPELAAPEDVQNEESEDDEDLEL
jgi:hypothetical protein